MPVEHHASRREATPAGPRYAGSTKLMCRPDVLGDRNQLSKLTKSAATSRPVAASRRYARSRRSSKRTRRPWPIRISREIVEMEIQELQRRSRSAGAGESTSSFCPRRSNDKKNVILEIRGGEGGDGRLAIAADLVRMYARFAENERAGRSRSVRQARARRAGTNDVIALVSGQGVYSSSASSGGVNRVKPEFPRRRRKGRSTPPRRCAVMPEALPFFFFFGGGGGGPGGGRRAGRRQGISDSRSPRSGGRRGQGVNTTNRACRSEHPSASSSSARHER